MKTFEVTYIEKVFYQTTQVQAINREDARNKFLDKLNEGDVLDTHSEELTMTITEE